MGSRSTYQPNLFGGTDALDPQSASFRIELQQPLSLFRSCGRIVGIQKQ